MKAIITIGISASGKTTWAEAQFKRGYHTVSRDDIRSDMLMADGNDVETINIWSKWNFKREKEVTEEYWCQVLGYEISHKNIILADTNLNLQRRAEMQKRLESLGYEVEYKQFDISFEEAVKRDKNRKDTVGANVIYKQWLELYGEKYEPDLNLPKAILVDVDGTLAHMDGKRGPFEWNKVGSDRCDEIVKSLVNNFDVDAHVIIMSGRDGCCYEDTLEWLVDNKIYHDNLFMRDAGDMRKDSIVKKELFDKYIRGKYNVIA